MSAVVAVCFFMFVRKVGLCGFFWCVCSLAWMGALAASYTMQGVFVRIAIS